MKRLVVGVVGGGLTLALIVLGPPVAVVALAAVALGLAALEYSRIVAHWTGDAPVGSLLILGVVGIATLVVLAPPDEWPEAELVMLGLGALWVLLAVGITISRSSIEVGLPAVAILLFGLGYLGFPLLAIDHVLGREPLLVVVLLAVVWSGDSAAYYVGRAWGHRKLAPVLSPNKSWEGALASSIAGVGIGSIIHQLWIGSVGAALVLLLLATSVCAQLGDLFESLVKRGAGVKDSGTLLPGHGGLLDRLDALLLAAPVFALGLRWI